MNNSWSKYRLIILVIIVIAVFLFRSFKFSNKDGNPGSTSEQQSGTELIRNSGHLVLTKHAKCRMECRDITEEEIKEILHDGSINYQKSNLNNKRGATYAVEGYSDDKQHLRIIFAPEKNKIVVVTCIDLDREWQCDCN